MVVDPHLIIDFALSSDDNDLIAALSREMPFGSQLNRRATTAKQSIRNHLIRHPEFAGVVNRRMEESELEEAVKFAFTVWRVQTDSESAKAKLLAWLASGDVVRTHVAIQQLYTLDRSFGDVAQHVEKAIDRIAEEQQLDARDMFFLTRLKELSPEAASHAARFLTFWLDNPEQRDKQAEWVATLLLNDESALHRCVSILLQFPERAKERSAQVRRALDGVEGSIGDPDRSELQRLWNVISETDAKP